MGGYNTGTYGREGFILPLFILGACSARGREGHPSSHLWLWGVWGCPLPSSFFSRKPTGTAPALPYDPRPKGQGEGPAHSQAEGRGPRSMSVINAE